MPERRQEILDAAVELAREKGVGAVSVRSVAAAAGIGATTLRYYFPSQRELINTVLDRIFDENIAELRIADAAIPAAERLTECLVQFFGPSEHTQQAAKAWFDITVALIGQGSTEGSRQGMMVAHRVSIGRTERWLRALAAEGAIDEADIEVSAAVLLALIEGLMLHLLADPERVNRQVVEEAIGATVERLLRA